MTDRKVLVTGGAGFVGAALVGQLAAAGPVRVLDDLSTGRADSVAGLCGVDLVVGSVLDEDAVTSALDGVDVVFHLASRGVRHSIHAPRETHNVNATGTLTLLEASHRAGIRRFVYVSSSEVYGSAQTVPMNELHPTLPNTVYGGSKLAGEAYARVYHRTYGLPTVTVRLFNAYGPRSHYEGDSGEVIPKFLVRARNGLPPVVFGNGAQTRDFTFVTDVVQGIVAAAETYEAIGEVINLGSGKEISITELASRMLRLTGRSDLEPKYAEARPGDVHRLFADATKARGLLRWAPGVGLDEGLRRLLAWHEAVGTDWSAALAEDVEMNWTGNTIFGDRGR
jgi:UDP-glucose 4-epimerase